MEKICKHHGKVKFYKNNACSKCSVERVKQRRRHMKQLAIDYKGGKCERCDYDKCNAALEFHHRNDDEKLFGIGEKGYSYSWETVKKELDKCMMLCSNCHREIHYDD